MNSRTGKFLLVKTLVGKDRGKFRIVDIPVEFAEKFPLGSAAAVENFLVEDRGGMIEVDQMLHHLFLVDENHAKSGIFQLVVHRPPGGVAVVKTIAVLPDQIGAVKCAMAAQIVLFGLFLALPAAQREKDVETDEIFDCLDEFLERREFFQFPTSLRML